VAKLRGKAKRKARREAIAAGVRLAKRGEEVTAEAIAEEMTLAGSYANGELAEFDWQGLIDFIEKILPLILKIIAIFT